MDEVSGLTYLKSKPIQSSGPSRRPRELEKLSGSGRGYLPTPSRSNRRSAPSIVTLDRARRGHNFAAVPTSGNSPCLGLSARRTPTSSRASVDEFILETDRYVRVEVADAQLADSEDLSSLGLLQPLEPNWSDADRKLPSLIWRWFGS